MKKILYTIVAAGLCCCSLQAQEQDSAVQTQEQAVAPLAAPSVATKALADSAYAKGDYASAIDMYESILATQGESDAIYYNLGNSYYKHGNVAKSILNLERAHLLNPGDSDIRFNLEMAKSKAVDKVESVGEFFLTRWISSLRNSLSADGWARGGIAWFILMLALAALYVFGKKLVVKKIGFVGAVLSMVFVIIANVFASQQKSMLVNRQHAIILSPSVTAKSTPDEGGTDLFILHEGHKVAIKDNTMKEWCEIQLEDGSIGWVPTKAMEII